MKTKPLLLSTCFVIFSLATHAQKQPDVIFPATPFDKALTMQMLDEGTSTLRGVIQKKIEDPSNTLLQIEVELFPCTPYFNEWLELRKKNKKGKKMVVMTPEAYTYRILSKASDADGTFEYKNLKPGKYYLQSRVTQGKSKRISVKIGEQTTVGYNVYGNVVSSQTTPITEMQRYNYNVSELVSTIVEITADGQLLNIKL